MLGAVSANDFNSSIEENLNLGDNSDLSSVDVNNNDNPASNEEEVSNESKLINTSFKTTDKTVVYGEKFSVKLLDENGIGLANKRIYFEFNGINSTAKTDSNGIAKLKLKANPGKYVINYYFKGDGYNSASGKTKITLSKIPSKIIAANYVAYMGIKIIIK